MSQKLKSNSIKRQNQEILYNKLTCFPGNNPLFSVHLNYHQIVFKTDLEIGHKV